MGSQKWDGLVSVAAQHANSQIRIAKEHRTNGATEPIGRRRSMLVMGRPRPLSCIGCSVALSLVQPGRSRNGMRLGICRHISRQLPMTVTCWMPLHLPAWLIP